MSNSISIFLSYLDDGETPGQFVEDIQGDLPYQVILNCNKAEKISLLGSDLVFSELQISFAIRLKTC